MSEGEEKYRSIFEHSAVSLWEEDVSRLRSRLAELKARSGFSLRAHLAAHPDFVQEAVGLIDVTDVNRASLRLFEADRREQLLGPLDIVLGAVSRAAIAETILAIDEGTSDIENESSAVTLTGRRLSLIVKTYIPPADAAYPRMLVSLIDITARKEAEAALAWERGLFSLLMDNLPDRIYFKDTEGRFIRTSRSHAAERGLADPEMEVGKTDADFSDAEHARQAHRDEQRIIQTGEPLVDFEEKVTFPGRPDIWFVSTKMPLRDPSGAIAGTFGISHDITARRDLEQKNQQLATLVESADDAIVGLNLDRRITIWNKGAERLYGYTAAEMLGTATSVLIPAELEEEAKLMRERVARGEKITHYETSRLRKDGSRIVVSLTLSAIRDQAGRIVGMASTARDVTEQRAIQAQLYRAQRLESLATLAAGVAHQFNNINTVVGGYLQMIQMEKKLPARMCSYVEAARTSVQKAVDITDRLLALTGSAGGTVGTLRLDDLARAVLSLHEPRIAHEKVRLALNLADTPPVRGDESRLQFVLSSLLGNALDALLDRSVRMVRIRTGTTNNCAYFEIEDSGCGIPEPDMPRIFSPFYSAKGEWAPTGSPQAKLKGVGLSLAIASTTISEYGGRIDVQSTKGVGSTFRVLMPLAATVP